MPLTFRPIDAIMPRAAAAYGGKAENLAALTRNGFAVPRCFALSAEAARAHYQRALPEHLRPERMFSSRLVSEETLARAHRRVMEAPLPAPLRTNVRAVLAELEAAGLYSVAVRSSSLAEDQDMAAAAGLHETLLHVRGEDEVLEAIRRCWASLFQPRVLTYLQRVGSPSGLGVGIVLQAMLPAEVSGVMFTVNPLTGDDSEIVIDAAYGLGTVVTGGTVTPDTYRIDKDTGWVRDRVVGEKGFREDPAPSGGIVRSQVPAGQAGRLCLPEHQLGLLVDLARRVERQFGDARDIEWAVAEDRVYVLQARPATALGGVRSARRRPRPPLSLADPVDIVWSNVNVGEALPGVATPLTWSVLSAFSEIGFRSVFQSLGCTVPKHERLVGNFRGRIYLNLSELARILAQVPGLRPSLVLPLGGAQEIERLEHNLPKVSHAGFLLRLPRTVSRLSAQHLGLELKVEHFERSFTREVGRLRALDLRVLPGAALDATLSDVHRLLNETGTLMLTIYGGLLASFIPLRPALESAFGERALQMQQDLLGALSDVVSAAPAAALLGVARVAAEDPQARDALLGDSRVEDLSALPAGPTKDAFVRFLAEHGHRAVREAELSEPRWRERPALLFDAVRLHLRHGELPEDPAEVAKQRLARAEQALDEVPLGLRQALRGLLAVSRRYMRLRERLRGRVTEVLDLLRGIALDASRRLQVREPECGPEATFFLQLNELHAVLRGEARTLSPLLRRRREQYARDMALPSPPDTFVGYPRSTEVEDAASDTIVGLGASGGVAEGRVCVLSHWHDADALQPGDIVVVRTADVGYSPLFLTASALVTEAGGPLSHACVVAREYGLPAVVNVPAATRKLRTGDRARVDGDVGIVTRL